MYIKSLELQNVRCFTDLKLDFITADGAAHLWTFLVGENGVGKSTLLQIIALCLSGTRAAHLVFPSTKLIRGGMEKAEITVSIYPEGERVYYVKHDFINSSQEQWTDYLFLLEDETSESLFNGLFVAGYGTARRLPTVKATDVWAVEDPRAKRVVSLFDEWTPLKSVNDWLTGLDYDQRRFTKEDKERSERLWNASINAINSLLPDIEFSHIDAQRWVIFKTPYGQVTADGLSDGYKGTLVWICDLLHHLSIAFPDAEDLLQCAGVVLLDEIDLHLHPAWQRHVMEWVRGLFPNMQFIVTTHSPITLQSAKEGEVIVLQRYGDRVEAFVPRDVQGYRVDQILSGEIFGYQPARDVKTEKDIKRYTELLSVLVRSAEDEQELQQLRARLQDSLPPPGETEEERAAQKALQELLQQAQTVIQDLREAARS